MKTTLIIKSIQFLLSRDALYIVIKKSFFSVLIGLITNAIFIRHYGNYSFTPREFLDFISKYPDSRTRHNLEN
jgi:hypothetical protein